jgi:hypothetical protein
MYGIVIQHRRCPRCSIRRTARLARADALFCFNCHLRWSTAHGWAAHTGGSPASLKH